MPAAPVLLRVLPVLLLGGACGGAAHRTRPLSRLDAEYLRGGLTGAPPPATATDVYRQVLARSLGSRCQMFPTDSQLYDRRAQRCGATAAAVLGIARLYLETAAGPDFLPALLAEGRVRWVDLAEPGECRP